MNRSPRIILLTEREVKAAGRKTQFASFHRFNGYHFDKEGVPVDYNLFDPIFCACLSFDHQIVGLSPVISFDRLGRYVARHVNVKFRAIES